MCVCLFSRSKKNRSSRWCAPTGTQRLTDAVKRESVCWKERFPNRPISASQQIKPDHGSMEREPNGFEAQCVRFAPPVDPDAVSRLRSVNLKQSPEMTALHVLFFDHSFLFSGGSFVLSDGTFLFSDGSFVLSDGTFLFSDGSFVLSGGSLLFSDGSFVLSGGSLLFSDQ
ncbi:hypothetical protein DNTS_003945 [Danionella cerebrum]|uniref:Uncharacterized protein n=1 Tax=Danionella cerebrum TaxID=2873325 RepID=A0A553QBQ8_9TELE|nr:hypothetical protein DNTS_003945 [Danionella translucida]